MEKECPYCGEMVKTEELTSVEVEVITRHANFNGNPDGWYDAEYRSGNVDCCERCKDSVEAPDIDDERDERRLENYLDSLDDPPDFF